MTVDIKDQARVVLTDDGDGMVLTIYSSGFGVPLAVIELTPQRALRLAGELLRNATWHIERGEA